jgi:hypothetical protein
MEFGTNSFSVCNGTPVTVNYRLYCNGPVADIEFCSRNTGVAFGSFVQRMLCKIGETRRIINTIDHWS